MANPLDLLGRAILRIGGMSPQQIRQQARAGRPAKPMPKANTTRPTPAPAAPPVTRRSRVNGRVVPGPDTRGNRPIAKAKPPAPPKPGSIQPQGQTNLFGRNGQPRDFRNPRVSANRPPTLSPVFNRSGAQATPPNPPIGGPGRQSPGQGFFDLGAGGRTGNPNPWGPGTSPNRSLVQSTATSRTAPSVPTRGSQTRTAQGAPAGRGGFPGGLIGRGAAEMLGIPTAAGSVPFHAAFSNFGLEGEDPDRRARLLGFRDAADQQQRIAEQQQREAGGRPTSRFAGHRQDNLDRINSDPRFAAPARRSAPPAAPSTRPPTSPSSAPVRASTAQLRPPAPSAFAPQVGQPKRPNAPQPSAAPQPQAAPAAVSPQYDGNDEPGRLGQSEGGYAGNPIETPAKESLKSSPKATTRRATGRDEMIQENIKRRRKLTIELD